MTSIFIISHDQ